MIYQIMIYIKKCNKFLYILSHSHKDKKLAIEFAEWLKKEAGLTTFIDSCILGYSNELLKK